MPEKPEPFVVYALTEIERNRTIFDRVGNAYVNKDGSITVHLRAVAVSGRLQLRRDKKEDKDAPASEERPA